MVQGYLFDMVEGAGGYAQRCLVQWGVCVVCSACSKYCSGVEKRRRRDYVVICACGSRTLVGWVTAAIIWGNDMGRSAFLGDGPMEALSVIRAWTSHATAPFLVLQRCFRGI